VPVDLRSAQHWSASYKALNPQGLAATSASDTAVLTQFLTIIEGLEQRRGHGRSGGPFGIAHHHPTTQGCARRTA
jgi:hypothetical protein